GAMACSVSHRSPYGRSPSVSYLLAHQSTNQRARALSCTSSPVAVATSWCTRSKSTSDLSIITGSLAPWPYGLPLGTALALAERQLRPPPLQRLKPVRLADRFDPGDSLH